MMRDFLNNLLGVFFPNLCVVCQNRLSENEKHVCLHCLSELPRTGFYCQSDNRLEQLFAGRFPFVHIAAFGNFVKEGSMQKIIHEMKYEDNPDLAYYMGRICGDELAGSSFISDLDYIVPIPLHPKRQKERGYNQSLELAKGISDKTGIHVDFETAARIRYNPSQAMSNSRMVRWENVKGVFELSDYKKFQYKHIMLVDDVVTTGSTLEACAREILKSKGSKISIYTLAATE